MGVFLLCLYHKPSRKKEKPNITNIITQHNANTHRGDWWIFRFGDVVLCCTVSVSSPNICCWTRTIHSDTWTQNTWWRQSMTKTVMIDICVRSNKIPRLMASSKQLIRSNSFIQCHVLTHCTFVEVQPIYSSDSFCINLSNKRFVGVRWSQSGEEAVQAP